MRKLIRDKLRFIPREGNQRISLCPPEEYGALLLAKLDEEISELKRALIDGNRYGVLTEAADVLEVLRTLIYHKTEYSIDDIIQELRARLDERGSFSAGVLLETGDADAR